MNAVVVGYGAIGPVHAMALDKIEGVTLYGICDIVKERADSAAKEYGTKAFYDYDECLKDENVDFVHICTPHYLHFEMTTKALDAGKRVVVEKPAAMTKEQLDILFEKYDVTKIFPIIQCRTNITIEEIKRIAKEENLGTPTALRGLVTWGRDADYYNADAWRGTKKYEGGGVLINQTIHTLDFLMYFGGKAKTVKASMNNFSLEGVIEVEDTVTAYIEYENGAKGIFFGTNAYPYNSGVEFEVNFGNDSFSVIAGKLYRNREHICTDSEEYVIKKYWGNGHEKTLYDLYVNDSKLCLNDVKDTMYTMFAIYESAETNKEVNL